MRCEMRRCLVANLVVVSPRRIAFLLVTIVLALLTTFFLGRLPVDIAVDLEAASPATLHAAWPGGSKTFEKIDAAYEPNHFTVRVTSPKDQEERLGDDYQLIAMAALDNIDYSQDDAWSSISTYFLLHGEERPVTLTLEGWNLGPTPYLSFEADLMSGVVEVQSGEGPSETLDLNAKERTQILYPITTDKRLQRFYIQVPRRALRGLNVSIAGPSSPVLHRLYLNTFIPCVFYGDKDPLRPPVGRIVENWSPGGPAAVFDVPHRFYLGARWVPTFLFCIAVFVPVLALVWGGIVLLLRFVRHSCRLAQRDYLAEPAPWKLGLFFWGGTFLLWFVFLVTFYPGTLNADSLSQWKQAQAFSFEPQHPPFYAWLMWVVRHIWDSPFSIALPQVLAGSGLVALAATLLWSAGVHRAVVLGMYALCTFSPRNMTMMISLIKDAPYGICMFGAALFLAWIVLRRDKANWLPWTALGLALGGATLFRHNGPMMVAGMLPFLILFFLRQWRGVTLCVVVTMSVFLGAKATVLSRLPMAPTSGGLHDLLTAHLAILVDRDVPMSNEEYAFLAQVRDLEDRWAYHERRVASTTMPFLERAYHRTWAKEHGTAFRKHYVRLVLRNPLVASRYFWDRGEFLVIPWQTETPMETYFLGIPSNDLALFSFQLFLELPDQLRPLIAWTASDSVRWLFWRPALPLYLVLIACLVLCLRTRDPIWAIIYLPFVINTGIIALAAISQASRYQFPLTFAAAFLIALAFIPSTPKGVGLSSPT